MIFISRVSIFLILLTSLYSQDSLQVSDLFSIKPKFLLPQSQTDIQFQNLHLNYAKPAANSRYFYTPAHLYSNPFGVDTRSSSFYTPRHVRDELNLMMHRPKDQAFAPVLGVAYIAYIMATKYLLVQGELEIKTDDILNCEKQLDILRALWIKNPQTCKELYDTTDFNQTHTYMSLERDINILVDYNLIKTRTLENEEIQYFPAIDRLKFRSILKNDRDDTQKSAHKPARIDSLLIHYSNPSD